MNGTVKVALEAQAQRMWCAEATPSAWLLRWISHCVWWSMVYCRLPRPNLLSSILAILSPIHKMTTKQTCKLLCGSCLSPITPNQHNCGCLLFIKPERTAHTSSIFNISCERQGYSRAAGIYGLQNTSQEQLADVWCSSSTYSCTGLTAFFILDSFINPTNVWPCGSCRRYR